MLPFEPEPKLSRPGFFFAKSISSFAPLIGESGGTINTFGVEATSVIGWKSFTGSYGIFGYSAGLIAWVATAPMTML